jgi:hypothetical protein
LSFLTSFCGLHLLQVQRRLHLVHYGASTVATAFTILSPIGRLLSTGHTVWARTRCVCFGSLSCRSSHSKHTKTGTCFIDRRIKHHIKTFIHIHKIVKIYHESTQRGYTCTSDQVENQLQAEGSSAQNEAPRASEFLMLITFSHQISCYSV